MKRLRILRASVLPGCVVVLAALPVQGARAQVQQQGLPQYQGPADTSRDTFDSSSTLDKDYGMSFLGAPGSPDPHQKAIGPARDPAATPDLFPGSTDSRTSTDNGAATEIRLPKRRATAPSETETPLYTTTEGSDTGATSLTTSETPLFDDGSDTGDGSARSPAVAGTRR